MAYTMKDGDVSIFKNEKATKENKQPQYRGTLKWNDQEIEVSLWVAESKSGLKYFNGKCKLKDQPITAKQEEPQKEPENDLPF